MKRGSFYLGVSVISLLLLIAVFLGGIAVGEMVDVRTLMGGIPPVGSGLGERVEEVERIIDREALRPSEDDSATAGAIAGLLESLDDPYALYFNPEHYEYFNEQNDGQFYGIGVTIAEQEGGVVYVVSTIADTPAEEAGLKANDEFQTIDGVTRDVWTVDEVVKRVRGPEGTTVEVSVRRPNPDDPEAEPEILDFTIERARIDIPNLMTELDGEVGYIRLFSFNARADAEIGEALTELREQGAKGFVLDVRDNPGGLLQASVEIASFFIEDGVIVRVEERNRPQAEQRTVNHDAIDEPLVVLMNGNSASASEVLAGALQDYDRALLVGEQSFGKGSVQTVEPLSFGGGIKFTIAHYLTPKERMIDGVGLTPDVIVEMELEDQADPATDIQRQRAFEELRKQL